MSKVFAENLHKSWATPLQNEFSSGYMSRLKEFLESEYQAGKSIFPRKDEYFRALDLTPLDKVRVVILGQDPYHGDGQAHGLCFSVKPDVKIPPSLVNIYKEIERDLGIPRPSHGFLERWAEQGVLLLNSVLTVERSLAASHQKKGWESFTDAVIRTINNRRENVVYMLWGSYAQKKASFVDEDKNLILTAPHPSPLSAHRGFLGCGHFSKANEYLKSKGYDLIDWDIESTA